MAPMEKLGNGLEYYKCLEFNNVALGNRITRGPFAEVQYATWVRYGFGEPDYIRHFSSGDDAINEQQAMRDFCVRSGLIRECDLLANEMLPEIALMFDRLAAKGQDMKDQQLLTVLQNQAHQIMHEPKDMIFDRESLEKTFEQQAETPGDFISLE